MRMRGTFDAYSLTIMPDSADWLEVGERHICRHERRTEIPYCTEIEAFWGLTMDRIVTYF
jgi:hypothetical protein